MIGAILGDIIGSTHEFGSVKTKDFELLDPMWNMMTDDSMMTLAVGKAVMEAGTDFELLSIKAQEHMHAIGRRYLYAGYGGMFRAWLESDDPKPYNSFGNGSAMRVSACGIAYDTLDDVFRCAEAVTKVTHNHPEGMKAARAIAQAVFMARHGHSKAEIRDAMSKYYKVSVPLKFIRPNYRFTEDAKYTMGPALVSFFESTDYEDAVRNAVSLGGDADTLAAIAGSIAAEYHGIPKDLIRKVQDYIVSDELKDVLDAFEKKFSPKMI
jgi:type I restriction enzyme M protein